MSKRSTNTKVDVLQQVRDLLEEAQTLLETADVEWNHLESPTYMNDVYIPLTQLTENVEVFQTAIDNGDYETDEPLEDFEE